ncbi:hypothetical protein AGDE_14461 [Angomonas deanei]|nr:hypothetical protein AGDE_14461 [Angomonas deanei]|eukprot:EPY20816.1 hypothetical protein AGDE_14461 [Angomonas deanei]
MKEVNANPGHPAAGYVSLLVHVQKRMENPGRTSIADFVLSRGTLRLLLGVSARDSLGGRGGVLHIDDLDVEGTKKEDVAPRLGVIASKDVVSGGEEHSSKVLSCEAGLRTGKIHDGGEAGTTDGTGFDTSSYSGTLTTGLAFSPEVSAVNRRTQPELPPQRERRKDMVRLVGCAADLQEIIARAPKSWQLPENVLETNEELREELKQMKGFQSQDAIAGSLPDAHTNPFPVPRLFSLRSPLHVQGTRPLGSEWTAKPLSLNTSMRHSFSWQRGGSLVRAISVPKELYSYDFHRKSKSRLNVSQRTKKTTERRPQEEKTQKVGGERFSYVRQLIESGAFGSPDGNKSFSFLRTDEETKPEMGSGLAESAPVPQQEEEAVIVDETPLPAPTELPPQPTLWKEQHLRVEQPKKLCLSPGSPLHMNTPTIHTSENKSGMSQRPPMTPSDRFAFPHSSSISPDEDDLST